MFRKWLAVQMLTTTDCAVLTAASPHWPRRRTQNHGFTLIELMIVVVIVAVLTAIAFPSYQYEVRKSRRTTARTALLALASREEQYYSLNNNYTSNPSLLGYTGTTSFPIYVPDTTTTYYKITASVVAATSTTLPKFTFTATPQGDQGKDSCTYLSVDSLGNQLPTTPGCW